MEKETRIVSLLKDIQPDRKFNLGELVNTIISNPKGNMIIIGSLDDDEKEIHRGIVMARSPDIVKFMEHLSIMAEDSMKDAEHLVNATQTLMGSLYGIVTLENKELIDPEIRQFVAEQVYLMLEPFKKFIDDYRENDNSTHHST